MISKPIKKITLITCHNFEMGLWDKKDLVLDYIPSALCNAAGCAQNAIVHMLLYKQRQI